MILSLSCWGFWHSDAFFRLSLPSLLPQLGPDDTLRIHTTSADAADWGALGYAIPHNLELVLDVRQMLASGMRPKGVAVAVWHKDVEEARRRGEVIALIWPDVIWGENTFAHYRKLLDTGHTAIIQHFPRIASEGIEVQDFTHRHLATLAIAHEHPISRAHRYRNACFPDHKEMVNWRVWGGILTRLLAATPTVFDPRAHEITDASLLADDPGDKLHVITDSDDAIGLSLAPQDHEPGWVGTQPFTAENARAWQRTYYSPANATLAQHSYLVHPDDAPAARWMDEEREADAVIAGIFGAKVAQLEAAE